MKQSQNQNGKRGRGRNRRQPQNPLSRNYESNGPDVKIRGNTAHIADKYMSLARDALSSGDHVSAENYYQHAEHYLRLIATAKEQQKTTEGSDGVTASADGQTDDNKKAKKKPKNRKNGKAAKPNGGGDMHSEPAKDADTHAEVPAENTAEASSDVWSESDAADAVA